MFTNKTVLISGGTGSFGSQMLRSLLKTKIKEIRILSRDEKKQEDLRRSIPDKRVNYVIGDIRDFNSTLSCTKKVDYVFQAAALKQVPTCEFFPMEAYKTNVLGTSNIIDASIQNNVKKIVVLSTDKAVYPINAMGISKAMMEKVAISKAREISSKKINCKICITRYGNVMSSRGSLIPFLIKKIKKNEELTLTDPSMTRFLMSLDESVELVKEAFKNGKNGDTFIQKSPAATINNIAKALLIIFKKKNKITIIGPRHGEKIHESLCSSEEMSRSINLKKFYRIPGDLRNINYDIHNKKNLIFKTREAYSSNNTKILNLNQLVTLLKKTALLDQINN
jgi:UDP-N-acetylglucosamine 4,6-dehydratase/5-epimerase